MRIDGGIDPVTERRYRPTVIIPAGPDAEEQANARTGAVAQRVNQPLDRYLDRLEVQRKTKNRYREMVDLHVRPLIGSRRPVGRIDGEIIDSLYVLSPADASSAGTAKVPQHVHDERTEALTRGPEVREGLGQEGETNAAGDKSARE